MSASSTTFGYSPFEDALDRFRGKLAEAAQKVRQGEEAGQFWNRFGVFTRASSDRKDSIATRHQFFLSMMYGWLEPTSLDKERLFGSIDREYLYYRDKGLCQAPDCGKKVEWSDAEFHHVVTHAGGGRTVSGNGALVHRACHPKAKAEVEAFAKHWRSKRGRAS